MKFRHTSVATLLLAVSLSALAQTPTPGRFRDAKGNYCAQGSGVTLCPTLKTSGDSNSVARIIEEAEGRAIVVSFCVSEKGTPQPIEVKRSTGVEKVDRALVKFVGTWRYNPGTVDGAPASVCGMAVEFAF